MIKTGFLRRCWWGLFCILLFIIVFAIGILTGTDRESSDKFSSIVFFTKYSPGHSIKIQNPPSKFMINVHGGTSFKVNRNISNASKNYPYIIKETNDSIIIQSLSLKISQKTANDLWPHYQVIVTENQDGSQKYEAEYDAPMVALTGVYIVNKDVVVDHHFTITNIWLQLLALLLLLPLYLTGIIIRLIISRVKKKHQ